MISPMDKTQNDSLAWDAFQYVAGEMDDQQRVAFESMLAEDQRALDAVADAVELWVSRPGRIHDRALWTRQPQDGGAGEPPGSWGPRRARRLQP